jgi:hypothetical protein
MRCAYKPQPTSYIFKIRPARALWPSPTSSGVSRGGTRYWRRWCYCLIVYDGFEAAEYLKALGARTSAGARAFPVAPASHNPHLARKRLLADEAHKGRALETARPFTLSAPSLAPASVPRARRRGPAQKEEGPAAARALPKPAPAGSQTASSPS